MAGASQPLQDFLNSRHPVAVFADRYGGVYSGGRWLAVSRADDLFQGEMRATWVLGHGPSSDDIEAAEFWDGPPNWIAAGDTPDEAIARLRSIDADR